MNQERRIHVFLSLLKTSISENGPGNYYFIHFRSLTLRSIHKYIMLLMIKIIHTKYEIIHELFMISVLYYF